MRQKLKIGILVNSENISAWEYEMLDRIEKSSYAEIALIIENNITMLFTGTNVILNKELYEYAEGFNKIKKAIVIKVTFESNLETLIKL